MNAMLMHYSRYFVNKYKKGIAIRTQITGANITNIMDFHIGTPEP